MRIDAVVFAFALGSSSLALAGCDKPDATALQVDAAYTETVSAVPATASATATGSAAADAASAATGADASPGTPTTGLGAVIVPQSKTATGGFAQACAGVAPSLGAPTSGDGGGLGGLGNVASGSSASPAAAATCGDKPLPACPMTAWMKANAGPAAAKADTDLPALALVLDKIATFAPAGYPNWASISKDGAAAARAGQLDAARASCRSCHTQYKAKYKAESRALPLP